MCRMSSAAPLTVRGGIEVFNTNQPMALMVFGIQIAADGGDQRTEMQRPWGGRNAPILGSAWWRMQRKAGAGSTHAIIEWIRQEPPLLQTPVPPSRPSHPPSPCRRSPVGRTAVRRPAQMRMVSWIRRAIGRAPISGSKPCLGEVILQRIGEDGFDFLLVQLFLELHQELVDHAQDDFVVQRRKRNDGIQAVAELRREHALDLGHFVAGGGSSW